MINFKSTFHTKSNSITSHHFISWNSTFICHFRCKFYNGFPLCVFLFEIYFSDTPFLNIKFVLMIATTCVYNFTYLQSWFSFNISFSVPTEIELFRFARDIAGKEVYPDLLFLFGLICFYFHRRHSEKCFNYLRFKIAFCLIV